MAIPFAPSMASDVRLSLDGPDFFPATLAEIETADAALKHEYGRLLGAGVEIWECPVTVHAKVAIADDEMIVGTIDYDAWTLYRNPEIALLSEDAGVADRGNGVRGARHCDVATR